MSYSKIKRRDILLRGILKESREIDESMITEYQREHKFKDYKEPKTLPKRRY